MRFIQGFAMVEKNMKSSQALVSGLQKMVKAVKEADPDVVWYVYNDQSKGAKVLAKESDVPKIPSNLKEFFGQWLSEPGVKQNQVWFEGKIAMDKDPEVFMTDAAATMELMVDGKIFLKPLQHAEMEENFMIMNSFIGMNEKEHEEHIQSIITQWIREKCWTGSVPSFTFTSKPHYDGIPYSEKKDWDTRKKLMNHAIYVVMRTGFLDYTICLIKATMRSKEYHAYCSIQVSIMPKYNPKAYQTEHSSVEKGLIHHQTMRASTDSVKCTLITNIHEKIPEFNNKMMHQLI